MLCAQCSDKTWLTSAIGEGLSADLHCHLPHKTWRSSQRPSYIITSTTTWQLQTQAVLPRRPSYSFLNPSPAYFQQPQPINYDCAIHGCWMSSDRLQCTEWLIKKPYTVSLRHYLYKQSCKQTDFTTRGENPWSFILFICFRHFPLTPIVNLHYFFICVL